MREHVAAAVSYTHLDVYKRQVKSFVGTGNEAAAKKGGEAAVEAAKAAGWTDIKCIEDVYKRQPMMRTRMKPRSRTLCVRASA